MTSGAMNDVSSNLLANDPSNIVDTPSEHSNSSSDSIKTPTENEGNNQHNWVLKPPPKEVKSWVWKFYKMYDTNEHVDKIGYAHCIICSTSITYKSSTSKLQNHLFRLEILRLQSITSYGRTCCLWR